MEYLEHHVFQREHGDVVEHVLGHAVLLEPVGELLGLAAGKVLEGVEGLILGVNEEGG
jgi:hypothetical protein